MKTFKRICIKNHTILGKDEESFTVERGKEYITSPEKDGEVTVFAKYWAKLPVDVFAGEIRFTS